MGDNNQSTPLHKHTPAPSAEKDESLQGGFENHETTGAAPASLHSTRAQRDIVQLQRLAGNRYAAQSLLAKNASPVQRKFGNHVSPQTATAKGVITKGLGVSAASVKNMPSVPAKDLERPKSVEATVDVNSIRDQDREDNKSVLSNITGMARAEQRIVKGASTDAFFHGGHLIGDQLIAGTEKSSFTYFNVAPQVAEFNTPSYSAFEGRVKHWAKNNNTVNLKVELEYPDDYDVSIEQLIANGVVPGKVESDDSVTINGTKSKKAKTDTLHFPRRIPKNWKLKADIASYQKPTNKSKATYSKNKVDPSNLSTFSPTMGNPYAFSVETPKKPTASNQPKEKFIQGAQWAPTDAASQEEIVSLVAKNFPKLGNAEEIMQALKSPKDQEREKINNEIINIALDSMKNLVDSPVPNVIAKEDLDEILFDLDSDKTADDVDPKTLLDLVHALETSINQLGEEINGLLEKIKIETDIKEKLKHLMSIDHLTFSHAQISYQKGCLQKVFNEKMMSMMNQQGNLKRDPTTNPGKNQSTDKKQNTTQTMDTN